MGQPGTSWMEHRLGGSRLSAIPCLLLLLPSLPPSSGWRCRVGGPAGVWRARVPPAAAPEAAEGLGEGHGLQG